MLQVIGGKRSGGSIWFGPVRIQIPKSEHYCVTEVQIRPEGSLTHSGKSRCVTLRRSDFVLVTDDIKVWIGKIENISLLEAFQNVTLVHSPDGELTMRSLSDCEGKLDRSIFFRASRRYIVNLSHVKRLHFENGGIVLPA